MNWCVDCVAARLLFAELWLLPQPITHTNQSNQSTQPMEKNFAEHGWNWKNIITVLCVNEFISTYVNNGARWIFTSFSLVIMALMLGNRFETSHYASYECGLFQKTVARVKYEITFYTVALTFLIFEYELLFIFPLLLSLQVSHKSF